MSRRVRRAASVSGCRPLAAALAVAVVAAASVAGCGKAPGSGETAARGTLEEGFAVGLLLPESKTARYEAFDRPLIERHVKQACPRCSLLYLNAQQDAAKQQS